MATMKCSVERTRVERLRAKAGAWLLDLRRSAEITADELAEQVGLDRADVVEIETGRAPVPPALYQDFANVFAVERRDFAKTCLMYGSPSTYEALFGDLPVDLRVAA